MIDVLEFLLMVTALLLLLGVIGAVVECHARMRDPLPPPDDPRLRNVEGIREWRERKQKIRGRWVS